MKENGPSEGHKRIDLTLGTAKKLDDVIVVTSPHTAKGTVEIDDVIVVTSLHIAKGILEMNDVIVVTSLHIVKGIV